MTRLEEECQEEEEERAVEENTVEEPRPPSSHNDQLEPLEVDERVNVKIEEMKADFEVEAAERERVESNEAGNVILCCFAVFLIQLYYFDL